MKIRRFIADNLQEAVRQARVELGEEALIIHTRKFKPKGLMGFFSRPRVEITVALDEDHGITPPPAVTAAEDVAAGRTSPPENSPAFEVASRGIIQELRSLKQMVAELGAKIGDSDGLEGYPQRIRELYKMLVMNHVSEDLAREVAGAVREGVEPENTGDSNRIREACYGVIKNLFKKPRPIEFRQGRPTVVAMIGPTGVGKTTTIAKLAANFTLLDKRRVGLVTVDTYRIAAVEQLKTYAEIIGIPLEVVFHPEGLRAAIARQSDKDIIFIDTAGRSPRNEPQINELAEFLKAGKPDEILLVLSSNTHTSDLLETYRRFNVARIDKLVFTKLDESERYGQILNVAYNTETSVAYITNGQNVPDDIAVPDLGHLARMVLGEVVG